MHLHYESRCERRLLVNYLKEVDGDVAEVHGEFEEEACWELSRLQDRKQRWRNSWADNTPVMWFQRWCKNNTHSHVKGKLSGGASTKLLDPIVVKGFLNLTSNTWKLDNFDRRWPLRVKINSVCLPQAPHYCLVSPPATDADSPPTFLHPRYDTAVVTALHGSKLSHGDVVGDPLRRDDVRFLEVNIYKPKDVVTNWREK